MLSRNNDEAADAIGSNTRFVGGGMSTWETFHCPLCNDSFDMRIDLSLDRPLLVRCPNCGQEQRYVIKDGRKSTAEEPQRRVGLETSGFE